MSKKNSALGLGLDALLGNRGETGEATFSQNAAPSAPTQLPLDKLVANPLQPRRHFDEKALESLTVSVKKQGVLEPLLVDSTPGAGGRHTIIAGERRFRAAKLAGILTVPVHFISCSEDQKLEIALLENLQREDLTPTEQALAFKILLDLLSISQSELAERLGCDRSTISNSLRLLSLPQQIQASLDTKEISAGHARALLSLKERPSLQKQLFKSIVVNELTVREAERAARAALERKSVPTPEKAGSSKLPRLDLSPLEKELAGRYSLSLSLKGLPSRHKVELSVKTDDDFQKLLSILSSLAG